MDEELLGIAPTEGARFRLNPLARKMGKYALFFTTDRLLVVKLTGIKTVLAEGFLGPLGNLYSNLTSRKLKDLTGMSLDEVLKSDKDNSIIPYSEIVKVTMGKGKIVETWGTIISTKKDKYNYVFYNEETYSRFIEMVERVVPDKLLRATG